MAPLVAIVGRPNVGKSTLFNRLVKDRRAIVDDKPGVTRDRLYSLCDVRGKTVRLVDTGGLELDDVENIVTGIRDQAITAVNEADLVLFVVDVRGGLSPIDEEISQYLRRYNKPIVLALNKVDTAKQNSAAREFHKLGYDLSVNISAEHGNGIGALLDLMEEQLPEADETEETDDAMRVAIIGRPNVGKSSILNSVFGDNRMVVNDEAGTTRDVIDVNVEIENQKFIFLDTAGIRKKANIHERMEAVSSIKARQTISRADICILVLDATEGVTAQDKALAGMIDRDSSGAVIALNKWDLKVKDFRTGEAGDAYIKDIRIDIKTLDYAPVVSTCALTGQRVPKLVDTLLKVARLQKIILPAGELTEFIEMLQLQRPVPSDRGKPSQIMRMNQTTSAPARFRIFVRGFVQENYLKFIERKLREHYDLEGIPVRFSIVRV